MGREGRWEGGIEGGGGKNSEGRKERNSFKEAIGVWRRIRIIEMKNIFDHYFSPSYNSTKFKRLKIKAGKHKEGNQDISFPLWPGLDHPPPPLHWCAWTGVGGHSCTWQATDFIFSFPKTCTIPVIQFNPFHTMKVQNG